MPWPSSIWTMPSIKGTGRGCHPQTWPYGHSDVPALLLNKDFHIPIMPRHTVKAKSRIRFMYSESDARKGSLLLIWNEESLPCNLYHLFALPFFLLLSLDFSHKIQVPFHLETIFVGTDVRRAPATRMDSGFQARHYVLIMVSLLLVLGYWTSYLISLNLNFFNPWNKKNNSIVKINMISCKCLAHVDLFFLGCLALSPRNRADRRKRGSQVSTELERRWQMLYWIHCWLSFHVALTPLWFPLFWSHRLIVFMYRDIRKVLKNFP